MRHPVLISVLAVLAAASGVVAVVPELGGPEANATTAEPVTPAFSLRRVAPAVTRTVGAGRLQADIDALLAQPVYGDARDDTCLIVADPDGRPLFAQETAKPLIPASAMKLLTGAVVLSRLGADSRYVTPVRAAGPAADGAIGDLWFVGTGDPLLATADFAAIAGWLETPRPATSMESLADRIFNAGVRRIGRLLGDESRYDGQRYVPTWEPHYATTPEVGPQSALNVNSGYVQWRPRAIPATSPATNGANVLAGLLRARGIAVGSTGEGRAPAQLTTIAEIESPPVSEVVAVMMRHSDNLAAELLVKELGARFGGGGTTAAGLGVVRSTAADLGLPTAGLANSDGSGLDRADRLTCDLIQRVLATSRSDGALAKGLPVAGTSGTLTRRFLGTTAVGKIKAKTGSLSEVVALAGFATGKDGRDFPFSLVANDLPSDSAGSSLQNQLANVLAGYPDAPTPDLLSPEPPRPVVAKP
ncbi:MAG: D-alanyl-D-alanine carboxypeptidase/D-alanyl-D-alanine endopeptidase [Acidimicrobiales bacterium]